MTVINKFTLMDETPGAPASDNTICEYSGLMSVTSYMETKETLYTEEQVRELGMKAFMKGRKHQEYSIEEIIESLKQTKQ